MKITTKKSLLIAGLCSLLLVIGAVVIRDRDDLRSDARRAWKDRAIAGISSALADPAWPGREVMELKKNENPDSGRNGIRDPGEAGDWFSERLILMRNGDWLAYTNICRKEDRRIHDLFLARGSDGQWYYSTYHFCIGMLVLRMDDQADSLATFTKTYSVRTFDGHSDECLRKTWPKR